MKRKIGIVLAAASLLLIGVGAALIYLPAGFLLVGLLVWADLTIGSRQRGRDEGGDTNTGS